VEDQIRRVTTSALQTWPERHKKKTKEKEQKRKKKKHAHHSSPFLGTGYLFTWAGECVLNSFSVFANGRALLAAAFPRDFSQ
jgi:hypothetical protein